MFLVERIETIVHSGVPDQFLGLILLPLVEKAAEHLTAVDEAWDGQMNFALYHCLGPSIQTALFNAPLVVVVGWAMGKDMDLNFEIFMVALLVLSILVVGNFLRDGESNYLEGFLLVVSRTVASPPPLLLFHIFLSTRAFTVPPQGYSAGWVCMSHLRERLIPGIKSEF